MEPQVSFDHGIPFHPEKALIMNGDCGEITSIKDQGATKQPAKKQTRQWAAWTRQEEESFFTALRQVGKNFEKITNRVQSKNKDQVRHYYYRLVRRMNKLLGPELCLDAKNSKDTNAAMLRWWSLLEKYSCKASKLHLKPRRFKIFIETLEHQLLKDRKKNIRKRNSQGENCSTAPSLTVSNQGRTSVHDARVKIAIGDGLNIQKLSSGKGSSLRRNANTGVDRNNFKGESSPVKAARQRRRPGNASTAAYKRWEKAAIAGVSLVADAAEHLERTALDKLVEHVQDTPGEKGFESVAKDVPCLQTLQQNPCVENNLRTSTKLKLQLFPIDESTRRALEMDNHNPHLELTLSTRKKISSILEHINRKWGNSSVACGELTFLPFDIQREKLVSCQKWTQESVLSAGDVYAVIGSPTVFRLRYGWFSNAECGSAPFQAPLTSSETYGVQDRNMDDMEEQNADPQEVLPLPKHNIDPEAVLTHPNDHDCQEPLHPYKDQLVSSEKITSVSASSSDFPDNVTEYLNVGTNRNLFESADHASTMSWQRREASNGAIRRQLSHMDKGLGKGSALSTVEWADSLTNISIGDLLCEASHSLDTNSIEPPLPGGSHCLQMPFSCDSFDAAIAAHINKHHSKSVFQPTLAPSIWDAEATCDAFSFQKNTTCEKVETALQTSKQPVATSLVASSSAVEKLPEAEEPMDDDSAQGDSMDDRQSDAHPEDSPEKDLHGLTDIYWPDSLGPLDLDIPSCRYHSDPILSDSLGGLNRLITSSLDAFQNCSFFGLDKKELSSKVEARETATFSDYRIDK